MREFIDDDEGFINWLKTHTVGYVVNTSRKPSASYLVLHRATCPYLPLRDTRTKAWTRQYIKICATDTVTLQRWADRHFSRHTPLTPCPGCKP